MKPFVVKGPAVGKTTCSLISQFYDKATQRTKTTYRGSFNAKADPSLLPAGVSLRPGVKLCNEDWNEIRRWLSFHGTFGQPPVLSAEILEEARRQILDERFEEINRLEPQSAIDLAVSVLNEASIDIGRTVTSLRAQGVELTKGMLNYVGTDDARCRNDMDRLRVDVNRIRVAARDFEAALKAAGLMKSYPKRTQLQMALALL